MTLQLPTRRRPTTAHINGQEIPVAPGETLLQAALRAGVDFPNSCRVGGCGACKCTLQSGKVRELTETGYLLTADELDRGTILACQSAPSTDVRLSVDLPETVRGKVVEQLPLAHDITRLTVALDRPLAYRAGQFARLQLDSLPGVRRSYSFATPPRPDGTVQFFVRLVRGGQFSGHVHTADLVGTGVELVGPSGAFWLRPAEAPLLFVAGGSGLAPILAMLQDAAEQGVQRPATLLFGARTRRDLYAQDALKALQAAYPGTLRVVQVLSEAMEDPTWVGARGLVTDHISAHLVPGAHAYLCGPPGMVDAAETVLAQAGVPSEHLHADRFASQAHTAPPLADRPVAGVLDYAKYALFYVVSLVALLSLLAGGMGTTLGMLGVIGVYLFGDALGGDDTTTPDYTHPEVLTGLLWGALPVTVGLVFVSVWTVSTGDPLGLGAAVEALTGFDALAAREASHWVHHLSGITVTALMVALVAINPAHELTHRTWDRTSLQIGRWLLAFSFDTIFSIEHVYGHHRYVSTVHDPATAPRGRNVYVHIVRSTIAGNISAWKIERTRLQRRRLPVLSWHNAVIRGHLLSVGLVGVAWAMGGPWAVAYFVACALGGKSILEIVNYMEHYGMVRDPSEPVRPRHSWNTNKRLSSWTMFNLTRHSHHHAQGEVPYGDLRPYPDAPMMVGGYLTTMLIALVPPLWHHLMTPRVLDWDARFASPTERKMAEAANARSGIPAMMGTGTARLPQLRGVLQR